MTAPRRKDFDEFLAEYYEALGRFITSFSVIEQLLNFVVWRYARLHKHGEIARALLSSLRIDAATNHLNRLIAARKLKGPDIAELKLIFDQLGKITRTRNDIVHFGIRSYNARGHAVVSNKPFAHVRERVRKIHVSPATLAKMTADLDQMFIRLVIQARIEGVPLRRARQRVPHLERATWQYKPREQAPRRRKRPGKPQERKALPRPSGE